MGKILVPHLCPALRLAEITTWLYCLSKNGNFKSLDIKKLNLTRFFCEGNPGKNGKFTVAAKFNGSASSTKNIPSNFTQKDWTYKGSTVSIIYKK